MGFFLPANATFRQLTWADFRPVSAPAPVAGQAKVAAQTAVVQRLTPNLLHFGRAPFLKRSSFILTEDPNVSVDLATNGTFVESRGFYQAADFSECLVTS